MKEIKREKKNAKRERERVKKRKNVKRERERNSSKR